MTDSVIRLRIKDVDLSGTQEELMQKKKRGQLVFGNAILRDSNRYVPMKSGALRGSGSVENEGKQVTWESYSRRAYPYGRRQYQTQFDNYTTPGTGPYWEKKASGIHMPAWEREVSREYQ